MAPATADDTTTGVEDQATSTDTGVAEADGERPTKFVRLPKAEKRAIRKAAEDAAWALKKQVKAANKLLAKEAKAVDAAVGDGKPKQRGQNKVMINPSLPSRG